MENCEDIKLTDGGRRQNEIATEYLTINKQSDEKNVNNKWQQIIKKQSGEPEVPQVLTAEGFNTENRNQQYLRQRKMMQQAIQIGKQNLLKKQYLPASKELSKALMAFEFIMKNHVTCQTISKQQIKQMMIGSIYPTYNNLALCHLKLKNYSLVISFCNQVLGQDSDNIKARYRRAMANKQLKNTQEAINDFSFVNKLDSQMRQQCEKQVKQCKLIEQNIKKRRKLAAQKFLSGYQRQEQTKIYEQNQNSPLHSHNKPQQKSQFKAGNQESSCLRWIKQVCNKIAQRLSSLKTKSQ